MPYIATRVSSEISPAKEQILTEKFGKAITLIGKPEAWLMLDFEDKCRLYFKGNKDEHSAYVEVKLLGKAAPSEYEKLTAELTEIIHSELGIPSNRIYVKYEEVTYWGWNGNNF